MAAAQLPELFIPEEDPEVDIKTLLRTIKPSWEDDSIKIKKLSGGYSCNTYVVHSEGDPDDAITVRVKKLLAKLNWLDPKYEETVVQEVSRLGIFPKVYAIFQNGYCYKYIEGKPLMNLTDPSKASDDELPLEHIAKKLARIHHVKIEGSDYSKPTTFETIKEILDKDYPDVSEIVDKEVLTREINELFEYGKKFNFHVVLCHGDCHPGNMVWDSTKENLTIVDWELVHVGYQAFDVTFFLQLLHFYEIMPVPGVIQISVEEAEEKKKHFIRTYLESWLKLQDSNRSVTEDDFQKLYHEVVFMSLIWPLHIVILMTSVLQKGDFAEFPAEPTSMMKKCMESYFRTKEAKLSQLKKAGYI